MQYTRPQARFTAHLRDPGGPLTVPSTKPAHSIRVRRERYPTATLGLQALRTSHQARGPASGQSSRVPPPYLGPATHLYDVTVSPQGLFAPVQEHAIAPSPQGAQGAHDAYPYLPPLASSHFDPLNLPYTHHGQGQPIIGNAQYTDVDLDWLSSVAEASYTPTNPNPTILVSPASGNYATFTSAPNTCVTGSHSDIGPVCVPGAPASPFNSLGPGLTPSVSATPSTFDFSASPGLTQHSPVVPYAVHPLTEEPEGEQGFNLVALFSRPPSVPYGNLAIELPHSKEIPSAPPCDLLMVPLPTQPVFTDHTSSSARRVPGTAPPRSSGRAPYATGRKEVRFPNQKKVNVVEDMCRRFPEASDGGKLLKRICAAEWYHKGDLEPTFGNGSEELTYGLALGFEAGHSVLLGFTGNEGECLYCGHTSPKRDRIIAHMREHLGLRPFVCMDEKCPCRELPVRPAFSSREALTSHLRNPIRSVTCNFCFKSIKSNNFRRHLNARHRDQVQLPEQHTAKRRSKSLPA